MQSFGAVRRAINFCQKFRRRHSPPRAPCEWDPVRSRPTKPRPQTLSSNWAREKTRPGLAMRCSSRRNSVGPIWTSRPARRTRQFCRSRSRSPAESTPVTRSGRALSMSEIKSEHIDGVTRRELESEECARWPEQPVGLAHPCSGKGVFSRRCSRPYKK
jgi:hypothetical protein